MTLAARAGPRKEQKVHASALPFPLLRRNVAAVSSNLQIVAVVRYSVVGRRNKWHLRRFANPYTRPVVWQQFTALSFFHALSSPVVVVAERGWE